MFEIIIDHVQGMEVPIYDCRSDRAPIVAGKSEWREGDQRLLVPCLPENSESSLLVIRAIRRAEMAGHSRGTLIYFSGMIRQGIGFFSVFED